MYASVNRYCGVPRAIHDFLLQPPHEGTEIFQLIAIVRSPRRFQKPRTVLGAELSLVLLSASRARLLKLKRLSAPYLPESVSLEGQVLLPLVMAMPRRLLYREGR